MIALVFLTLNLAITIYKQPYVNFKLNRLEAISLLTSAITVYCGIFFILDKSFKDDVSCNFHSILIFIIVNLATPSKDLLFSIIVISHSLFIILWLQAFFIEFR